MSPTLCPCGIHLVRQYRQLGRCATCHRPPTPGPTAGARAPHIALPGRVTFDECELTPGVIDDNAVAAFTNGYCGALALAFEERGVGQVVWLVESRNYADGPEPDRYEPWNTLHYVILTDDGCAVDIEGPRSLDEICEEWDARAVVLTGEALTEFRAVTRGHCTEQQLALADTFAQALLEQYGTN